MFLLTILALSKFLYNFIIGSPLDFTTLMEASLLLVSCVIMLPLILTILNQHNTIHVMENGLRITTFGPFLFWKFIPWQDINGIEIGKRMDRWRQPVWIIKVRRLTPWHRYLGKFYNAGSSPIITLTSDMDGRYELMNIIEKKCSLKWES
jgi:hypothetical protein